MELEKINIEKLVEVRKRLGFSQVEVAKAVGASRHTWCKKEKGVNGITLREALTVAKFFNLPVEEIFAYDN